MELLEIEIKSRCDNPDYVVSLLEKMNSDHKGKKIQKDTYFNHPSRDFARTDEALRIRHVSGKNILTYKGPKLGERSKTRFEQEVMIEDYGSMEKILFKLGFVESGRVEKTRDVYKIGDIEVCIDNVPGLGIFVELEKIAASREEVEKELFSLAESLGLNEFERKSYLEMLLEKKG